MSDLLRNSTDAERAQSAAGQQNAACIHGRIKANCMECSAPEMLELLRGLEKDECPWCGADSWAPMHAPDCKLAALLAKFPR